MKQVKNTQSFSNPFGAKNWEVDIDTVSIERCDTSEDPLGYRAVFYVNPEKSATRHTPGSTFVIGASLLEKREKNLNKVGYRAPMTSKAIEMIADITSVPSQPSVESLSAS